MRARATVLCRLHCCVPGRVHTVPVRVWLFSRPAGRRGGGTCLGMTLGLPVGETRGLGGTLGSGGPGWPPRGIPRWARVGLLPFQGRHGLPGGTGRWAVVMRARRAGDGGALHIHGAVPGLVSRVWAWGGLRLVCLLLQGPYHAGGWLAGNLQGHAPLCSGGPGWILGPFPGTVVPRGWMRGWLMARPVPASALRPAVCAV